MRKNIMEGKEEMKKIFALLIAVAMLLSFAACQAVETPPTEPPVIPTVEPEATPEPDLEPWLKNVSLAALASKEYGTDYIALYEKFGKEVTIADVVEDPDTGLAYIEKDGVQYELGMDFLSMANVYNCTPVGEYTTAEEVYAAWWKLYMQRWNYLMPEIPLYSNEYYDLYNAQIKGVEDHPTNPYWAPNNALIDWTSEKEDNSIIIGNTTELSGKFRYANFGASNPNAADLDVQEMTVGLETVSTTKEGGQQWNETVVAAHEETDNADGTKTFKIQIKDDLVFSDGSPVTAKDYVAFAMAFSTPVAAAAAGKDHRAGMTYAGYETFATYDGTEGSGTKEFAGVRLLDDYTFSITIAADYLPYYYDITYASFSAQYRAMWIGEAEVMDDGNGAYFTDEFYAKKSDGSFVMAEHILKTSLNTDDKYPFSGAYMIESYDDTDKSAVVVLNPNFKGNYEGMKPAIAKVVYKKIISSTQLEDLKAGNLDCISGITGGDETNEALALADGSNGAYVYTHYSRAGYGKLGFRGDYGSVQFTEVRQAIAYCMDRAKFAKDFTGGYGGVVDGPYYPGSWMYKAASANGMLLNAYSTSADSAIEVLEAGGWVYDKDGNAYAEGVRYKKLAAEQVTENDINFKSKDGVYTTTKVGDFYYMPLVLNWYGTSNNPFTDQLMTGFMANDNMAAAGFVVQNTVGDFNPMLDELYQAAVYGYYAGSPLYTTFNFATGFTSTVYDYSYNWTVDPGMYDDYSICYVKDLADIFWLS